MSQLETRTCDLMYSTMTLRKQHNFNPARPAKTGPFIILLCLTPDDFTCQGRASVSERVNTGQLLLEWLLNNVVEVL